MKRLLDLASGTCLLLASLALVLLVVVFGHLVFGRYVLNVTPTWVEQLALLLIIVITFLGAAAGVHEDTHLGVSFLREALPTTLRNVVRLGCDLAVCVFGIIMCISCIELVRFSWGSQLPMLGIPEGSRSIPGAVCGALMAVFAGYRVVLDAMALAGRGDGPTRPGIADDDTVASIRPDAAAVLKETGPPPAPSKET